MKKLILSAAVIFGFVTANAQTVGQTVGGAIDATGRAIDNGVQQVRESGDFQIGVHGAIPIGDTADSSDFAIGAELRYEFPVKGSDDFKLGFATGYTHYIGGESNGVEYDDAGVIPLAVTGRLYFEEDFYIGTDLGYGIVTGGGVSVVNDATDAAGIDTDDSEGGFYFKPQIGYQIKENVDLNLFYQGVSGDAELGSFGLGVNFDL